MKIEAPEIRLDLTCWVRGPHTGVGLSAFRAFEALRARRDGAFVYRAVCRDGRKDAPSGQALPLDPCPIWQRAIGDKHALWHSFDASLAPAWRSPRVLTIHDLWTLRPNAYQDPRYQRRQAKKLTRAIERTHHFVTPSRHVKSELEKWSPCVKGRVSVIPWAPLLRRAGPPAPEDDGVSRYLGESRSFLLCVACLETRKNLNVLFKALEGRRDLDLALVGGPGYGAADVLRGLSELEETGTRVLRFQALSESALAKLYERCLALVEPSLEEGFGMPVIEAMGFAKPVLLSRIPVFEEVAAEAGLYFELEEGPPALRALIESVACDPRLREIYGAMSKARAGAFTWERTAELLVDVYRELLGRALLGRAD